MTVGWQVRGAWRRIGDAAALLTPGEVTVSLIASQSPTGERDPIASTKKHRQRRAAMRKAKLGRRRPAAGSLATGVVASLMLGLGASVAVADPAPVPGPSEFVTPGAHAIDVPDGVCAANVTARGGAGGSVIASLPDTNGAGAQVTATYPVAPGQPVVITVGQGGQPSTGSVGQPGSGGPVAGLGGTPDGGRGGVVGAGSSHAGAGGGGSTEVSIGGTGLIHAGGGGASAGGHDTQGGFGGDAGLPVTFGSVAPGTNGLDGVDSSGPEVAGGGQGGQAGGPGAGGAHSANPSLNGYPAAGSVGGNGGDDPNYDSGGGGGGGVFGGGGGASTGANGSGNPTPGGNGGGGGGGGASAAFAATPGGLPGAPTGLSAIAGPRLPAGHDGAGADGLVRIEWIACAYDLDVDKTVSSIDPASGVVTWTVTITNDGPDPMTRGDVVTLTDTLPGPSNTEVASVVAPTGVTCNATVGSVLPPTLTCSRPFDASAFGGAATGVRGIDVGEVITITYTQVLTEPGTFLNVATVTDRGNPVDNSDDAEVVVTGPSAGPRTSHGPIDEPQSQPPDGTPGTFPLDPSSLTLLDGGTPVDSVTVPGEGTYTIDTSDPANPVIVFTPEPGFLGQATPVDYRISDTMGNHASSTYTPSVVGGTPDETFGPQGVPQSVDPLANDVFDPGVPVDPTTLTLLDDDGIPVASVTVPGEGTYTIDATDPANPVVVFTPEPDFIGTATPVPYRVLDDLGTPVESIYTPTVIGGLPDTTTGPQGVPQSVDPLANDVFDPGVPVDPTTLTLLDDDGIPVASVTVPGEGTYTIDATDPANPMIVFTPEPDFIGTATSVTYQVLDDNGTPVESTYTPTVTPTAVPDTTTGPQGQLQTVDPLSNDDPDDTRGLDPTTLTLVDPNTGDPVATVTVPGVGTYTVVAGQIHFQPEPGFVGTGPSIGYEVDDSNGFTVGSTYAPTVTPVVPNATPDTTSGPLNQPQSVNPLTNDTPGHPAVPLDVSTLTLLDADGNPVASITVPGQGTYTVSDGRLVFTPVTGFVGTATPAPYRISDANGTPADSTYTPTIVAGPPEVVNDVEQVLRGTPVTFDTSTLVPGIVPGTVFLLDPQGDQVRELVVPGEGTWVVDPTTGQITFTPLSGFLGDPTPVEFVGAKQDGTPVTGQLTIEYFDPAPPTTTPTTPPSPVPTLPTTPPSPVPGLPATGAGGLTRTAPLFGALLLGAGMLLIGTTRRSRNS